MSSFQLKYSNGSPVGLAPGKIVCIGRNYMEHIRELNNKVPDETVLFMKPASALCRLGTDIELPFNKGEIHHELELSLLIGKELNQFSKIDCLTAITGYGLALDLTLRDLQSQLKSQGLPWEKAKAFDNSCPLSDFVACAEGFAEQHEFTLSINDIVRQQGNTKNMMRSIKELLTEIVQNFSLQPGDIVLTGTPAGIGALQIGDKLKLSLDNTYQWTTHVKEN